MVYRDFYKICKVADFLSLVVDDHAEFDYLVLKRLTFPNFPDLRFLYLIIQRSIQIVKTSSNKR